MSHRHLSCWWHLTSVSSTNALYVDTTMQLDQFVKQVIISIMAGIDATAETAESYGRS